MKFDNLSDAASFKVPKKKKSFNKYRARSPITSSLSQAFDMLNIGGQKNQIESLSNGGEDPKKVSNFD